MKKYIIIGIVVLALSAVAGGLFLVNRRSAGAEQKTLGTSSGTISLSEVARHVSQSDCWMAIEGKVYDVTAFIPQHPGGSMILMGCGKDATTLFNSRGGSGRAHSAVARAILQKYLIGTLAN